ncbi:MAG: DEAD/DEAH box helicase, partial [Acidaminococcaceae bacterium]|nr:DEAD/DEAH box helicase [Acidaminococcaceae bacterium]
MQPHTILKEWFGYSSFRPGQQEVVEAILSGRDCLAVLPTGAGKSICFQVPALMQTGLTFVISPLISLMEDQVAHL